MKNIILAAAVSLLPATGFAGGHSGMGGHGTGITVDNKVIEGETGTIVQNSTKDIWIWEIPRKALTPLVTPPALKLFHLLKDGRPPSAELLPAQW